MHTKKVNLTIHGANWSLLRISLEWVRCSSEPKMDVGLNIRGINVLQPIVQSPFSKQESGFLSFLFGYMYFSNHIFYTESMQHGEQIFFSEEEGS